MVKSNNVIFATILVSNVEIKGMIIVQFVIRIIEF